jgi:hypothetical protein
MLLVEIIYGDSLSGLLTTIGFFVMLIAGRRVRMRKVNRKQEETS